MAACACFRCYALSVTVAVPNSEDVDASKVLLYGLLVLVWAFPGPFCLRMLNPFKHSCSLCDGGFSGSIESVLVYRELLHWLVGNVRRWYELWPHMLDSLKENPGKKSKVF